MLPRLGAGEVAGFEVHVIATPMLPRQMPEYIYVALARFSLCTSTSPDHILCGTSHGIAHDALPCRGSAYDQHENR